MAEIKSKETVKLTVEGAPNVDYEISFDSKRYGAKGMEFGNFRIIAKLQSSIAYFHRGWALNGRIGIQIGTGTKNYLKADSDNFFTIKDNDTSWKKSATLVKYDSNRDTPGLKDKYIRITSGVEKGYTIKLYFSVNGNGSDYAGSAGRLGEQVIASYTAPKLGYTDTKKPEFINSKSNYANQFIQNIKWPTDGDNNELDNNATLLSYTFTQDNISKVLEFKDSKQTQITINILQEDNKFIANKPINVQGTFKWKGKQDAAEKHLSFNSQSYNLYAPIAIKSIETKVNEDRTVSFKFEIENNQFLNPKKYTITLIQSGNIFETFDSFNMKDNTTIFEGTTTQTLKIVAAEPSQEAYGIKISINSEIKAGKEPLNNSEEKLPIYLAVTEEVSLSEPKPFYFYPSSDNSKLQQYNEIYLCTKQGEKIRIEQVYLYSNGIKTLLFQKPIKEA